MSAHILIAYNEPVLPLTHHDAESEREILATIAGMQEALRSLGHEVRCFGVSHDLAPFLAELQYRRPAVVVNAFEGFGDDGATEITFAGLLEWHKVPFTGSPSHALALARNKPLTKRVLQDAGLPTAPFFLVDRVPIPPSTLPWPLMVKPSCQDASVGIDQGSVVTTPEQLAERAALILARYGAPVLVEQFLPGRELLVPVIETPDCHALWPGEMTFRASEDLWPIVTYDAKWTEGTPDYRSVAFQPQALLDPTTSAQLGSLAREAFTLLGLRDYGRVDFRMLPSGEVFILEVNPNPDLHPNGEISRGYRATGGTYAELLGALVSHALSRAGKRCD